MKRDEERCSKEKTEYCSVTNVDRWRAIGYSSVNYKIIDSRCQSLVCQTWHRDIVGALLDLRNQNSDLIVPATVT